MDEVTTSELVRRVDGVERRLADHERRYVLNEVYLRDMNEIRNDITEIKDGQKWMTRLMITQFMAFIIWLVTQVIERLPT